MCSIRKKFKIYYKYFDDVKCFRTLVDWIRFQISLVQLQHIGKSTESFILCAPCRKLENEGEREQRSWDNWTHSQGHFDVVYLSYEREKNCWAGDGENKNRDQWEADLRYRGKGNSFTGFFTIICLFHLLSTIFTTILVDSLLHCRGQFCNFFFCYSSSPSPPSSSSSHRPHHNNIIDLKLDLTMSRVVESTLF